MSSALFLTRAIEARPEYAHTKVDLVSIIGNGDRLETRIVDAEEWLKNSSYAPELQFLLAYIYYQIDRLSPAVAAIDAAFEQMPDSKATALLRDTIHNAAK